MSILNFIFLKVSSVKKIWLLFIMSHLILLLMMTYTFPVINNQIGSPAFDLQTFGYSVADAESIVNSLNNQTTELYLFPQLTLLDILYPFFLALFLSSLLHRLMSLTMSKNNLSSILLMVPFIAMVFDYFENICIILMITESVELSENFVLSSSMFTLLKSLMTSFAWVCILYYSIKWFRMKTIDFIKP